MAARLEAVRAARLRDAETPTMADRERYRGRPAQLRAALARRADPTVNTLLGEFLQRQRAQARVLSAAGPAVDRAFTRELRPHVHPISFQRGTLTLAVPDEAIRFKVDRQLRGGGRASIQGDLPKVARIVVTVSLEPFRPPELPRQQVTAAEAERERWEEVDAGRALTGGGRESRRCPACDWEFPIGPAAHIRRSARAESGPLRLVRVACPNCGGTCVFRES